MVGVNQLSGKTVLFTRRRRLRVPEERRCQLKRVPKLSVVGEAENQVLRLAQQPLSWRQERRA
jgi:hypothetical protein